MNNQKISEQIIGLQQACFLYAKEIIQSKQTLIPFGAYLDSNGEIIVEDSLSSEFKANRIEALSQKLKTLSFSQGKNIWVVCFDAFMDEDTAEPKEAVCLEVYNAQKSVLYLYYPYLWHENSLTFLKPFSE